VTRGHDCELGDAQPTTKCHGSYLIPIVYLEVSRTLSLSGSHTSRAYEHECGELVSACPMTVLKSRKRCTEPVYDVHCVGMFFLIDFETLKPTATTPVKWPVKEQGL